MAKQSKVINYSDIKNNPYYLSSSIKRPFPLRINFMFRSLSCLLFIYSIYYSIAYPPNNAVSHFTSFLANIMLLWFFIMNERILLSKNKRSRFLIPGVITAFFTFNLCGIFGVQYPFLYDLLKDNILFCYGLPILMMVIFAYLPLNMKIRFFYGTGLGTATLIMFTMIQSLIKHHDVWIFSLERMHIALTYSWICLVFGIVAIFKNTYDVKYYEAYLQWLASHRSDKSTWEIYQEEPSSENNPLSYISTGGSYYEEKEKPYNYNTYNTSDEMREAWDRGDYSDAADFQQDHLWTDGKGSK